MQVADYWHLIKEGTVPVVEEMLQESVGGSWMAVLDEQCHRRYHPLVA